MIYRDILRNIHNIHDICRYFRYIYDIYISNNVKYPQRKGGGGDISTIHIKKLSIDKHPYLDILYYGTNKIRFTFKVRNPKSFIYHIQMSVIIPELTIFPLSKIKENNTEPCP